MLVFFLQNLVKEQQRFFNCFANTKHILHTLNSLIYINTIYIIN